ncbi:MAG: hypothetical protein EA392_11945 [Cryomorphaceae bacterium]|nr:MAG: hypothetical protein EA392_11945 [Cryomorphaceae bacterium]
MTVKELRQRLELLKGKYPSKMVEIPEFVDGPGFFPGCSGTSDMETDISQKDFIILGQDQDKKEGFEETINKGSEEYTPTWREINKLFGRVKTDEDDKLKLDECFFTNALMGVRNTTKSTGKSPGFSSPNFVAVCRKIFEETIDVIRPKGIICLGIWPAKFVGMASGQVASKLICFEKYSEIDQAGFAVMKGIRFDAINSFQTTVVILSHPCLRHLYAGDRSYKSIKNNEAAEVEMLTELLYSQ